QRFDESFYEAWDRFNDLLRACPHYGFFELHQLDTFYNALNVNDQDSLNSAAGGNFLDKMPRECLKIIESKSKVRQSRAKAVVAKVSMSSSTPTISSEVAELKDLVKALLLDKKNQSSAPASSSTPALVKAVEPNCVTCGSTHSYQNCPLPAKTFIETTSKNVPQAAAANYNQGNTRSGTLPSNTITNPKEDLKGITTRSSVAYQGPTISTSSKVVKQGTKMTKDQVQTPSSQSTAPVQPPVIQSETQTPVSKPVVAPVSVLMPNVKSSIPYPSRRDNERRRDQVNEQIEKFYEIFKDMSFKISFTDALIPMLKFASTLKALIGNKEKLSEMARTPMNEHCSVVILNKLPRKLADPDRSIYKPIGIAKYVSVKAGVDFILFEEANAFLGLEDDPNLPEFNPFYYDPEGDILLLEAILNSEPLPSLPNHEQYIPSFKKELKVCEAKTVKSSVDEPPERFNIKDELIPRSTTSLKKRYFQIPIDPRDQEKTTFTCPYGTFAYRRMPFGLCNASGTFQRCMLAIFYDMVEKTMEVFMDDFSVFGNSFENCLSRFDKMLQRCKDNNLSLNWEKSHFMVKEGIVLGIKISKNGIKVDRAKVDVIAKLPHPTTVKGAVLGQRHEKHFKPIHYASKIMNDAESNYTTTEKEMLAVVYAFEKFRSYIIMNKSIVHMDHSALKYLFAKKDAKARLLRWVLLLQEFDFKVLDTKGAENLAADHLS
nr:retrovirus-related Pol polyprotein from transposon 17.6 [Tanacetum cinerariifolium]